MTDEDPDLVTLSENVRDLTSVYNRNPSWEVHQALCKAEIALDQARTRQLYSPSKLATAIQRMLDDHTGPWLTYEGWEDVLGVDPSPWTRDETLPSPEQLTIVEETVAGNSNASEQALEEFRALKLLPAIDITPFHEVVGRTLGDYLMQPLVEVFGRILRSVPVEQRKDALFEACKVVRSFRDVTPPENAS